MITSLIFLSIFIPCQTQLRTSLLHMYIYIHKSIHVMLRSGSTQTFLLVLISHKFYKTDFLETPRTGLVDIMLVTLILFLMITVMLLVIRPWQQGHDRRLHKITRAVMAAPNSTVVFGIPLIGRRHVVTADPENVQHVLKSNFPNYPKGGSFRCTLQDLFGDCIVNADGDTWRMQRLFAAREFSAGFLQFYGDNILDSEISERLLPFLAKAADEAHVIDLQEVLLRFAYDNICRAAFTHDPESLSSSTLPPSKFSESFDNAVLLISYRVKKMLPPKVLWVKKALNIGYERDLKKYVGDVKRLTMGIVKEKHKKLLQQNKDDRGGYGQGDFLSRLMKLKSFNNNNRKLEEEEEEVKVLEMDDEFRATMVAGVILAGRDTTSAALTWFFWLVGTNPRVEDKILEEIKNGNYESRPKGAYEASSSREMPYTHAALCEAMRLYPPIPVVSKEVQNDDLLPDGTHVRKGDNVIIATYAMGRLERVWGPDWPHFRPERWLDRDSSRFIGRDPYTFPVFNAGPRICLGKEMAFVQMKRLVAAVLPRFRVVPATPTPHPDYVFDLTAKMKGGFPVKLLHRTSL